MMQRDLEETLTRKGLILIPKPEVEHYMGMSYAELASLPPDELGMMGFELARYGYYLQTVIAFFQSRIMICRLEIEKLVGNKIGDYGHIYGRDDKWMAAIAADQDATAWKRLEERAILSYKCLEYIPNRVSEMMKMVLELQQSRRRTHGKG